MRYFFSWLAVRTIAPVGRSIVGWLVVAGIIALTLPMPAELWKRYVDAHASSSTVDAITWTWLALIALFAAVIDFRRWKRRRQDRALRRALMAELKARR